jgi:ATP-dependent DNA helicase RecG
MVISFANDFPGWLNERQIKAVLYVKAKGEITNAEYQKINKISKRTATNDLMELSDIFSVMKKHGTSGSNIYYALATTEQ